MSRYSRLFFISLLSMGLSFGCQEPSGSSANNKTDSTNTDHASQSTTDTQSDGQSDRHNQSETDTDQTSDQTSDDGDDTGTDDNTDDSSNTDQDRTDVDNTDQDQTDTAPQTAEEWARALLAGSVTIDEAFAAISQGSGFPVITANDKVIFMHICNSDDWSVAGDFNNWAQLKMNKQGNLCYLEIGGIDKTSYYKFVQNDSLMADPYAQNYTYTEHGEISYITPPTNGAYYKKWPNFPNHNGLRPRTIRVYIPGNYRSYDVIYAHDGQNLFGGGWNIEEAMKKIGGHFLVVGIDNTKDRMNEYTHVDDTAFGTFYPSKGRSYAEFVNTDVRQFIESRFTTTGKRGIMGSSLGGLISLYIALLYPNEYSMVLALSPTTAWGRFGSDNGTTIEDLYLQAGHQNTVLYLDNGGEMPTNGCWTLNQEAANIDEADGASSHDNYCFTRHFVDAMAEKAGYTWNKDLWHWHEPGAAHNEAAWAARVDKPLEIFKNLTAE